MTRILACLDRSPLALDVHRVALEIAERQHADLCLFRVLEGTGELPEEDDVLVRAAEAELKQMGDGASASVATRAHAVIGEDPWRAICKEASHDDADLIVIGAHRHSALARALGTTAASVVNHADRSVLVVRARRRARRS